MNEAARPKLLSSTWAELRRRRVGRAALSYAVVAWVVLQLAEITFEPLGIPAWVMRWTILAAILGFPLVMVLAWYFDATAQGLARDERTPMRGSTRLFAVAVVVLTTAALAVWIVRTTNFGDAPAGAAATSTAPPNSIAVLPFADMSAERDQRWFADGIAEELLDRLARIDGLRVAARTSSFAFRDREQDMREIASALNVAYLLEGSVRKAGGKLRVTAQLIDARDGFHLWSQTYERAEADIFALQDEVTGAIAAQLRERIAGLIAPKAAAAGPTVDVRAHELYLQGRDAWRQRTPASLAKARIAFEQAVAIEPEFARAWSGLADTYLLESDYGARDTTEALALAEPAAVRAVTLDPESAEAWASVGLLRLTAGQHAAARANLERAVKLDPDYTMAAMWLSQVLGIEGDFPRQLEVLTQAHSVSPLEPVLAGNLAGTLAANGRVDQAVAVLRDVLRVLPNEPLLLRAWSGIEGERGALDRSVSAAHAAFRADPQAPANRSAVVQTEIALEDYAQARTFASAMPVARERAIALQWIALRSGGKAILPELAALEAEALAGAGDASPEAREVLYVAAFAHFAADEPGRAARALARIVGDPERIAGELGLGDPASLLVVALERAGEAAEAQRWRNGLAETVLRALDNAPPSARFAYIRALVAADGKDAAGALSALEAAYAAGFRDRWQLVNDPRLAFLRSHPEFRGLEQRMAREIATMRARVDREGEPDFG